jgi:hypothetical protein
LVGRLRAVAADLWHTFFADPIRENAVRSHGGGSTVRSMVALGILAFTVAALGVVLAPGIAGTPVGSDAVLAGSSHPGMPASVPTSLIPVAVALMMVTSFLGVFGAVLAGRALAFAAVGLVTLTDTAIAGFLWALDGSDWFGRAGLAATLAIPVAVLAMRWRRPPLPVVQAVACVIAIAAVGGPFVGAVRAVTTTQSTGGITMLAFLFEITVGLLGFVIAPAAIVAGTGAVSFGLSVVDFLGRSVDTLTGRRHLPFVLVVLALLGWCWVAATRALTGDDHPVHSAAKAVTLVVLFGVAVAWWGWATRTFDESDVEVEDGSALGSVWLAVLLIGPTLLPGVGLVLGTLESALFASDWVTTAANELADQMARPFMQDLWTTATSVAIIAWSVRAARRRPSIVAAFAGIVGTILGIRWYWNNHFADHAWGGLLDRDFALATLLLVTVSTLPAARTWRRTRALPHRDWATTAFAALALTALLAHSSFLEDPFRPLLGFTGIGLVFFGVVWGFLTAGAHSSATGLAGAGRTTIMLAYAVLTTTLVAWGDATASREYATGIIDVMGEQGKHVFGTSLLVSLMAVWIPIMFGRTDRAVRKQSPDPHEPQPAGPAPVATSSCPN